MARILIPEVKNNAWKWISKGYSSAWEHLGFEVVKYDTFENQESEYLMIMDFMIFENIDFSKYEKVFLFCSFNKINEPYNSHENYVSYASKTKHIIENINSQKNIVKWTFCNTSVCPTNFGLWGDVKYIPLGFDSFGYSGKVDSPEYDVVFVGGTADNGFNTKIKIMFNIFKKFMKDGSLKCGFYIDKKLSHEQELGLLQNAKVCLNIHDEYQRSLGFDLNERNFKALGLCGNLVSDFVDEGPRLLGDFFFDDDDIVEKVKERISLSEEEREKNIKMILDNHTYVNRVKQMLSYI